MAAGRNRLPTATTQTVMTELVHHAQGDFLSGTVDFTGTALESTGNGIAAAGYVVSASGVGAGVGTAISGVGNGMARIGTGMKTLANIAEGNYGQIVVTTAGALIGRGTSNLAAYGSQGREAIEGGVNAFFTPMNTLIGNIKYKQQ